MTSSAQPRNEALTALIRQAGDPVAAATLLPASDYFDLAGEEFGRRLLLSEGADGTQYCLRPDFTLPIAKAYIAQASNVPAAFTYFGPVYRQRDTGPTEFEQAGLELLAQPNPDAALYQVFDFCRNALEIHNVAAPEILLGSVALFEALLAEADMPEVWKPRLRRRFGNRPAMKALLQRLANPHTAPEARQKSREQLVNEVKQQMLEDGLSLSEGRTPEEIADRYLEKQALAAAKVPAKTIEWLSEFLEICGPLGQSIVQINSLIGETSDALKLQVNNLQCQATELQIRFPNSQILFDAGFSPRLHYYTGLVFELHNKENKTLVSGGQYDRLLQALGAPNQVNASGCAIWVKRLEEEGAR